MIQTQKEDKYLVADKYIEVAINYDAFLWVCRYSDDDANRGGDGMEVLFSNTDGKGAGAECTESARKNKLCALPKWLRESRGWQTTTNYVEDDSEYDAPYRCFRKFYSATRMNRYSKSPNDDAFLRAFHHALLEVHVQEGYLVCPDSGRRFPITKGIPNMLLNEDEV